MSNFEDELGERLRSRAASVSVSPDLADVEARAARRSGRRRGAAAVGVAAILAIGVAGVVVVQSRDDGTDPDAVEVASPAPPGTGEPDDADPTVTEPTTVAEAPAVTGDTAPAPTTELPSATIDPVPIDRSIGSGVVVRPGDPMPGVDPAEEYLPRTHEVYRRELGDGRSVVVRMSDETYASLFDIAWDAPTGSGDDCLGDHAVLLGVPGEVGFWGSAWMANPWFDDLVTEHPVAIVASTADPRPGRERVQFHLLRASEGVAQVVLVAPDGREVDRVDAVDGFAVVQEGSLDRFVDPEDAQSPQLRLFDADGSELDPVLLWEAYGTHDTPVQCMPGDPPTPELPPPGDQPADPGSAEAQIRARHALLVDRSVAADDKPDDLLDDDTGIQDAVAQVDAGEFSDAAADATYEIDDLVFTAADEAWFRYTITAPTGVFLDRFGIATFNGEVWQITRETICQDLALAQGQCAPPADGIGMPRQSAEWEQAYREWDEQSRAYWGPDCPPLSGC